jgi:hypothetical protein
MKIKSSKKLSLAKETLKTLNTNDLALVQGASDTAVDTSYCVVDVAMAGTSSNSL